MNCYIITISKVNKQQIYKLNTMTNLSNLKNNFLLSILFACLNSITIFAQGTGTQDDPYIIQDGGQYAFKVFKDFYGIFEVPDDVTKDGVVLELVADNWVDIFADAELTQLVSYTTGNFAPYTTTVEIPNGTPKGTKYYVYSNFPVNNGKVIASFGGGSALELVDVIPAIGSKISAGESYIGFEFTKPINFDECRLIAGDYETLIEANQLDRFISIEAKDELQAGYNSGAIKEGDEILFVLKNVSSFDGKQNIGDVVVSYIAANKSVMLVATLNTPESGMATIKSWMPENQNEGLIHLIFDGKLNKDATINASLSFGNKETEDPGEYYEETLAPTFVNDSTIEIDLRGKLRIPSQMVHSGTNYESMLLTIRGIEDEFGYKTYCEGSGTSGAYFINYGYEIVSYNLMTEFTPFSGQCIDNFNVIEIWMQETGGKLTFTGATFEYQSQGVTNQIIVPLSEIVIEVDEEDESANIITIPVPTFNRDADTVVKFSLTGVAYPDGMDYSQYVSAEYTTAGYSDTTGITNINITFLDNIYTIDGKSVKNSLKPNTLYIINGKKTIVK